MNIHKDVLRKKYLQKRQLLSFLYRQESSIKIKDKLLPLIQKFENIHVFLPIKKKAEVNTYPLIDTLLLLKKKLWTSVVNEDNSLTHTTLDKNYKQTLILNKWGIPTPPTNCCQIDYNKIQVVLLPLLIASNKGDRIGYGKGFYDRFLFSCPKVLKIGLSFFEPIPKIWDTYAGDIRLNYLISPQGKYFFE